MPAVAVAAVGAGCSGGRWRSVPAVAVGGGGRCRLWRWAAVAGHASGWWRRSISCAAHGRRLGRGVQITLSGRLQSGRPRAGLARRKRRPPQAARSPPTGSRSAAPSSSLSCSGTGAHLSQLWTEITRSNSSGPVTRPSSVTVSRSKQCDELYRCSHATARTVE